MTGFDERGVQMSRGYQSLGPMDDKLDNVAWEYWRKRCRILHQDGSGWNCFCTGFEDLEKRFKVPIRYFLG